MYVRQIEMPEVTLLPRWGCYFMSLLGMAQNYTDHRLTAEQCEAIYWICRETEGWNRKPVMEKRHETKDGEKRYVLWCNDHNAVLRHAIQYCWRDYSAGDGYTARYTGDQDSWASWVLPKNHKVNYTLVHKQTANGGHWVLGDAMRNMLWDPHGGLEWVDTPTYLRFYIGRKVT